jgi:hypothetical protein
MLRQTRIAPLTLVYQLGLSPLLYDALRRSEITVTSPGSSSLPLEKSMRALARWLGSRGEFGKSGHVRPITRTVI